MKNNRLKVFLPIIIAVSFLLGMLLSLIIQNKNLDRKMKLFSILSNDISGNKLNSLLDYISKAYVDSVSKEDLIEKTIPLVLQNLDPHSLYISANEFSEVNDPLEGEFEGIGIQFEIHSDTVVVMQVIPGGPSEKANIKSGDRIVEVNGEVIAGKKITSSKVVKKLKGPKGTKVKVGVLRKNVEQLLNFDLIRDKIPLHSIETSFMADNETGYIRIDLFAATTYEEFVEHTSELLSKGMKKMILDLRGNSGGILDASIRIANEFLEEGQIITYTEGKAQPRQYYRANDKGFCKKIKLVVLIDEESASASEILAGAIQDNDRGLIIGRRSFGKGLVMEQKAFPDGSALRLTVSRYYTATGRCIQKPYDKGFDDYYNELNRRFENGEYEEKDSIKFPDSLKYKTAKGKIVFGGGGIMPDIFVPYDTSFYTDFFRRISYRSIIHKFIFEYTDQNREKLKNVKSVADIDEMFVSQHVFESFLKFSEKEGVKAEVEDLKISAEPIKTTLKAYLANNILGRKYYFMQMLQIDKTYSESLEQVKKL